MKISSNKNIFKGEVTSPKIKRLENILDKRRAAKPLEQKIREKEDFLETLVYGYDYKRPKRLGK
jgi:hypothetical protein